MDKYGIQIQINCKWYWAMPHEYSLEEATEIILEFQSIDYIHIYRCEPISKGCTDI